MSWVNEVRHANSQEVIAIDGKTLRRSHDGERKAALHLISAYCCETGLVLTQAESKGKKNEIKTVPEVLDLLALAGCTVTLDAMSCQNWKDLTTIIEVRRVRHCNNKKSEETQYYISSLPLDAERAGHTIRSHWAIENSAHWVLDVTFSEDNSRIRRHHTWPLFVASS